MSVDVRCQTFGRSDRTDVRGTWCWTKPVLRQDGKLDAVVGQHRVDFSKPGIKHLIDRLGGGLPLGDRGTADVLGSDLSLAGVGWRARRFPRCIIAPPPYDCASMFIVWFPDKQKDNDTDCQSGKLALQIAFDVNRGPEVSDVDLFAV